MKKIITIMIVFFLCVLSACSEAKNVITLPNMQPSFSPTHEFTLTQTATPTPNPSPSPTIPLLVTPTFYNLYFMAGATDEQAQVLDAAILGLKNAVINGDKEYIANMIEYPIWMRMNNGDLWVDSKQTFLAHYDHYFQGHFKEVLSNIQLTGDYIAASYHGIFIMYYDDMSGTLILFSGDNIGKIARIEYGEISFDTTFEDTPTGTPTRTATDTPVGGINGYRSPTPTFTPYWFGLTPETEKDFSNYYGTWVITRYELNNEFQCDSDDNYAFSQIGKKIKLSPNVVVIDNGFLNSDGEDLNHIVFSWIDLDSYTYRNYSSPLPDNHPDKMANPLYMLISIDRLGILYQAEVTKSGRLVISETCYWYFLDKVSNN